MYANAEDGRLFTTRSGLWVPVDAYDIKGKPIHISAGSNFLVIATSSGHVYQVPAAYSPAVPSKTTGALPPLRKPARVTGLPFNATKPSPSPKVKPGVPPPPLAVDATRVAGVAGGEAWGAALLSNGTAWSWGGNPEGELCRTVVNRNVVVNTSGLVAGKAAGSVHKSWTAVCAGEDGLGGLLLSGECSGRNSDQGTMLATCLPRSHRRFVLLLLLPQRAVTCTSVGSETGVRVTAWKATQPWYSKEQLSQGWPAGSRTTSWPRRTEKRTSCCLRDKFESIVQATDHVLQVSIQVTAHHRPRHHCFSRFAQVCMGL
jgi:hypothetical protein